MSSKNIPHLIRLASIVSIVVAAGFTSGCASYVEAMNSIAESYPSDSSSEPPDDYYRGHANDASAAGMR